MMVTNKKAVILLSGGLDSATALGVAKDKGYECYALSFNYQQKHLIELSYAKKISESLNVKEHIIIKFDLRQFGGSALTDDHIAVPEQRSLEDMTETIPVTYVPGRNTIFLSHALSYAEVLKAEAIFTGVNALDYSGYPDCRPEYIKAYQKVANLATKLSIEDTTEEDTIKIQAPLIDKTKVEIIRLGTELGIDYSLTSSCYQPIYDETTGLGLACGKCDSCILRKEGFFKAGVPDPTKYYK